MGNFFYKVRCSLERFMYGRNGTDQLNVALLVLYVILALLQTVVIKRRSENAALGGNVKAALLFQAEQYVVHLAGRGLSLIHI